MLKVSLSRLLAAASHISLGLAASPGLPAQPVDVNARETIEVTATRVPQRVDQALTQVTVIDRGRIDAATGRTLAELLAGESGVQFWSNGGLGKVSSVSLRGLESRHTLLLIDGVRYGSATVGTPTWDNIPLDAIDRIEIVRGPMSGLYGSDALGGVIQIFTRPGKQGLHPEASAAVGSQSYREVAAGARFGSAAFDGHLRLQQRRTGGFSATNPRVPFGNYNPDTDGFEQSSVSGRLGVPLGRWRADATLLRAEGTTHFDDGPGVDSRAVLRSEVVSLQLAGPVAGAWRTLFRMARARDDFDTRASASAFTTLGNTGTTQEQFTLENQVSTPIGTALVLAEHVHQEVERPGEPFALSQRAVTGLGLGLNGEAGAHGWQANVRRDRNSQFGGQTTGAIGYGYALTPNLRATASFGTSFVAPSFNQLYFPDPLYSNPNLQPEEGRQHELGVVWRSGPVRSRVVIFDHRIRGFIPSGPLPSNIPRAKVDGVSASVDAVLGAFTIAGSIDSLTPINATVGSANFGRLLPRRVQDSGRLSVDWRAGAFSLGGTLRAFGGRFENAENTTRLGGFAKLDLRADWVLSRDWLLAARVNNALDKGYETVLGYNQPGREVLFVARWLPR